MKSNLADIRKDYSNQILSEKDAPQNPNLLLEKWIEEAIAAEVNEPNAMQLSTISNGRPKNRVVLLKAFRSGQVVFYTNYESDKASQMKVIPYVAVTFFWPELERQVRIEGTVEKVSSEESDEYFASRPRGSQIGAWVSPQSQEINEREILDNRLREIEAKFKDIKVQRPPHWGGYQVTPYYMEFWQGRPSRLHDRLAYSKEDSVWKMKRLAP
ncbi:MAG: pyridoxamine 5'-phosphate oxidase [Cyclobacteriaceae bacterium]|nr:pyridoxamine 5'-phosphate oxidase [Cyclobacteriaceae bacterium]MCH8517159.1 pyridoxamine 5'-phosphate oxidase [Cyclobacteriaceae bacterium]